MKTDYRNRQCLSIGLSKRREKKMKKNPWKATLLTSLLKRLTHITYPGSFHFSPLILTSADAVVMFHLHLVLARLLDVNLHVNVDVNINIEMGKLCALVRIALLSWGFCLLACLAISNTFFDLDLDLGLG
jgi:hypothetical protein